MFKFGGHLDAKSKMAAKNNKCTLASNNNDACKAYKCIVVYYNMAVWILVGNYISFTIAAGLIRLHMPGVKKYRV